MPEPETPVQGETPTSEALGTTQTPAPGSESTQEPEQTNDSSREEVERLKKDLDKVTMERNQLRNKSEEDRRKQLEDSEQYKELADSLKGELETLRQEREVQTIREDVLKEYPNEIRQLARDLNIYWDNADDPETAKVQLRAKLDLLKPKSEAPQAPQGEIHANNPAPTPNKGPDRQALLDEAMRTGDYSKLIQTVPSIKVQSEIVKET